MEEYHATLIGVVIGAVISLLVAVIMANQNRKTMREQVHLQENIKAIKILNRVLINDSMVWFTLLNAYSDLKANGLTVDTLAYLKHAEENKRDLRDQNKELQKELMGYSCFLTPKQIYFHSCFMDASATRYKRYSEVATDDLCIDDIEGIFDLIQDFHNETADTEVDFAMCTNINFTK